MKWRTWWAWIDRSNKQAVEIQQLRAALWMVANEIEKFLPTVEQWSGSIGDLQALESIAREAKLATKGEE